MPKDTSVNIRMDSQLKEKAELILSQFGLNMTVVVNMLFHQIVRDQAIPLSMALYPNVNAIEELRFAQYDRLAGYVGRSASEIAEEMERVIESAMGGEDV